MKRSDLISLRARIRKEVVRTKRGLDIKSKNSRTDEDSDSYDDMQRFYGQWIAYRHCLSMVEQLLLSSKEKK